MIADCENDDENEEIFNHFIEMSIVTLPDEIEGNVSTIYLKQKQIKNYPVMVLANSFLTLKVDSESYSEEISNSLRLQEIYLWLLDYNINQITK